MRLWCRLTVIDRWTLYLCLRSMALLRLRACTPCCFVWRGGFIWENSGGFWVFGFNLVLWLVYCFWQRRRGKGGREEEQPGLGGCICSCLEQAGRAGMELWLYRNKVVYQLSDVLLDHVLLVAFDCRSVLDVFLGYLRPPSSLPAAPVFPLLKLTSSP